MNKMKTMAAAIAIMCILAIPSVSAFAASCGETVRENTEDVLKAVDYGNNDQITALLAPSRYMSYEMLNKKLEIAKRDGKNIAEISDAEAKKELDKDNLQIISFEETFEQVQKDIGEIIQNLVDHTAGAEEKGAAGFTDKIVQNKEKLLIGLTYVKRLYDFNMGEKNICDVLLYEPGTYGVQTNVVDWLIKIGGAGGDALKLSGNANVFGYGKLFWDVTGYGAMNLGAFLEINRQKWIPDTSMNEWFLNESRAFIVEEQSSWNLAAGSGLYDRLYGDTTLRPHILPLLTVSEDSVFLIANAATLTYGIVDCYVDRNLKNTNPALYEEQRERFRKDLEKTAGQQSAFIDFWHRVAKPDVQGQLSSNRVVKDSLRIYTEQTVSSQAEWSAKFGKDAATGVREFISPLNLYDTFMFSDGMADGSGIRYYLSKALTERGLATYAHELTHLLVSKVMLNEHGARDGMQAEVYARGLFEPYELNDPPAFNLNLIYDRLADNERFSNADPERFQDETDLQEYMNGVLDVIYTLDYAEASVLFSKTPEEKKKWFHKLEQTEDTKTRHNQGDEGSIHCVDVVRELTPGEAEELNDMEDLIRGGIIASRYEVNGTKTTGTVESNGYYVVPLFSANYAGVQNDNGVSGDIMIRRHAFELLAEYGYYDGMAPYISNQYREAARGDHTILSDTYILEKIFGGAYDTMADFKMAMFQRRMDCVGKLKPVTVLWNDKQITIRDFQTLRQLMKEAVESDLIHVNISEEGFLNIRAQDTQTERLKAEIFRAYLRQTNDFKESVYGDGQEPEEPPAVTPIGPTETESGNYGENEKDSERSNKTAVEVGMLLAWASSSRASSQTIRWKSVSQADGYYIYGAKSNAGYTLLKTVGKNVRKWKHTKLKKGTQYKYHVAAYQVIEGKQVAIADSLPVYSVTKGGKYGNPAKLKAKKSVVRVKPGKKAKLNVKAVGKRLNKTGKKIRYILTDPSVANVSKKGVITGVKPGATDLYCVAGNGLFKKIRIKVG